MATGATEKVLAPDARASVPPVMPEAAAALLEVATIGLPLVSVRVPVTVSVGPPVPPLLSKTMLSRVWLTLAANVKAEAPLIVRTVLAAIALLVLRLTVGPPPVTPPSMRSPPAGITTSPAVVGLILVVPRLMTVPSV